MAGAGAGLLRKNTEEGWNEKHRNVVRKLVLEGVCVRAKVSVKPVTKWKAQKSTSSTIAEDGTPEAFTKWECLSEKLPRKSESGKEVLARIFSMKANGTEVISV